MAKKSLVKISDAAALMGVLPSTIRYYTDIGLLDYDSETKGGHRLYNSDDVQKVVNKVKFLSAKGMSMEEIKTHFKTENQTKKILVIDDEPEVGALITDLVSEKFKDVEVKVVQDGFSAGRVLNDYLPDLIILDLMMPGLNGFDVCEKIRSIKHLDGTQILAITGYDSEENRKKIMAAGANDYMAKPMDIKALSEKIKILL